jgi:hypothetical protein
MYVINNVCTYLNLGGVERITNQLISNQELFPGLTKLDES